MTSPAGSVYWWSQMNPTLEGLREFGEYPPTGREHLPGRWDDGVWGRIDQPVLEVLSNLPDSAPHFALRPDNSVSLDEWRQWEAHKRLIAAGVLEAETQESGLADCRVTGRGRNVLNPPADDPLDRAHRELFQGSKVEAVTAAVDEALKPRLLALATDASIGARTKSGGTKPLAQINEQLEDASVYAKWVRAQITAWLETRAEVSHGKGTTVDTAWIGLVIDGIRLFLNEYPAP